MSSFTANYPAATNPSQQISFGKRICRVRARPYLPLPALTRPDRWFHRLVLQATCKTPVRERGVGCTFLQMFLPSSDEVGIEANPYRVFNVHRLRRPGNPGRRMCGYSHFLQSCHPYRVGPAWRICPEKPRMWGVGWCFFFIIMSPLQGFESCHPDQWACLYGLSEPLDVASRKFRHATS